jgi:hypothetical protein
MKARLIRREVVPFLLSFALLVMAAIWAFPAPC